MAEVGQKDGPGARPDAGGGVGGGIIVAEMALGAQDAFLMCDEGGTPVYIVPRVRLEVRSGEVVKSRTVKQGLVIRETMVLLEALKREGSVAGPLTVQCFLSDNEGEISFIEINPRFGGGVPLSFAAGADYGSALAKMCEGKRWSPRTEEEYLADFSELTMLRYDQAVYV